MYINSVERITITKEMKMTTIKNETILNKGCQIKLDGSEYYCYNVTDIMHFVKLGKKGQILSTKNFSNLMNMTKENVLKFVKLGGIEITVGNM